MMIWNPQPAKTSLFYFLTIFFFPDQVWFKYDSDFTVAQSGGPTRAEFWQLANAQKYMFCFT